MPRRWLTWLVLGALIAVGAVAGVDALRSSDSDTSPTAANEPVSTTTTNGSTTDVDGWIAYGDGDGIWAVDPRRSVDRLRLSGRSGEPVAWSSDGAKLLILRRATEGASLRTGLFLLRADGTESKVLELPSLLDASLSPDGSQIVYSRFGSGMYAVDSNGGSRRLLRPRARRWYSDEKASFRTEVFSPAFSPDGRKIAYFDGMGDWGNGLRVMNADGSHVRVLMDNEAEPALADHPSSLAWSPDGSRLAFDTDNGIWVVDANGNGLTKVVGAGANPTWSPDGSRLAYATQGEFDFWASVRVVDADGRHVQQVVDGGPGAWNPVEPVGG